MYLFSIATTDRHSLTWNPKITEMVDFHHPYVKNSIDMIRLNAERFINCKLPNATGNVDQINSFIAQSVHNELTYQNEYVRRFLNFFGVF